MKEHNNSKNNTIELKNLAKEIFHITSILLKYSKNNRTDETDCLYTGLNILYKKVDKLNLKTMGLE